MTAKTSPHGKKKENKYTYGKRKPSKFTILFFFPPDVVFSPMSVAIKKIAATPLHHHHHHFWVPYFQAKIETQGHKVCAGATGQREEVALREDLLLKNILQSGMKRVDNKCLKILWTLWNMLPSLLSGTVISCLVFISFLSGDATQQQQHTVGGETLVSSALWWLMSWENFR